MAEYDTINRALRDAVILVETTGPALSAAGAAAGALKQGDPGYAESQALLKQAKADDEAAVKEQARLLGEKETAKTKMDKADEALKKCLADAAEKCKKKTAATTPQQNPGQNTAVGGAAAGGTDKPATGGTDAGTQPAGGNTVGGGATPGAAKTCKRSDDECAQLGVIAHQKQLEALRAQDDLRHVPDWLSQADSLQSSANSYHSMADGAFSAASKSAFDKNAANEAFYKQQGHEAQAKGDALQKQAKELRDKAEGAQGVADAAAAASKEAWKQYYDCLRLPPCPKDSNNTMNGSNVIGGTATGGLVNAAGGAGATGTSFSNCPAAQKQLDEARDWYQQASIAAANMQQALLAGDMQAAQFLQDSIVQDLHFARNHEQMAAYELAKCKDKPTNATAGGNPTNALNTGSNTTPEKKPPTGTNSGGGNAQPATNANSVGAATPAPANSIGGNTNPGANNNATAGGTNAAVPAPPETAASACMPGSDDCITPNQCISDSGCMNIKDICKTSPNACSKNKSGDSIYQVMMTASAINFGKVAERRKNLRYLSASYHLDRVLEPRISSALLRDKEAPAQDKKNENLDVALVATGNSSGEAFQLQMRDPSGKTKRMSMPEGMVLEPEKPGSSKPPAANGMSNLLTQQIGGFCMQFLKLPPAVGMIYKIAGPAMQQKFEPMRLILQAGRALAEKGKLHPDSEPQAYADSVRQYAVWANQEGWDEKKFGDNFVDRTHKNAEAKKIKWTPQIENALRAAVPGRWRDITQVLSVAHAWESSRNHASN